ncbi:flavoredoxin [Nostoc sp. FACHB-87]|uniref:flavoredoxin n=1 Tax=Nostocaceae TaxID=1162 RepID=UPI001687C670|nr:MULTISPECIES: flavoredoxin [Nostocaceae]MBD2457893.1 flavoredoxin [Nostoc sp. FACHB-87]MBD2478880.1 flavoredoxin [Anabaena sp. FACHB-83]
MIVDKIPDEAIVIRGGRNRPEDIERGFGTHPSGVTGISVESAIGLSIEQLAATIPHGQIGVTSVGAVRALGGDVICTSGRSSSHATLTGLTPQQISSLLTPTIANPAKAN